MASRSTEIPLIELAGPPRTRGRIHGEALREKIHTLLGAWRQLIEATTGHPLEAIAADFRASTRFDEAMRRWTPGLLEELEGIAEGADVPYELLYTFNCTDEHEWFLKHRGLGVALPEARGCSSLGACDAADGVPRIAQNLDIPSGTDGFQTLLHVTHDDSELESYVFTISGMLGIIGLNNAPVGLVNNSLRQLNSRIDGLPVNCVVRGVLSQRSYEDAARFLRQAPHASGQNYLIAGTEMASMYECSAIGATRVEHGPGERRFTHTNHPLASRDVNADERFNVNHSTSDTEKRLETLDTLARQRTGELSVEDMKAALRSHADPDNPVCRHAVEDPGTNFSAVSVVYELTAPPVMHLAPGPPCETEFRTFRFL